MKDYKNIVILKCKEKDLKENIRVLCDNAVEGVAGIPSVVGKGRNFYFTLRNRDEIEKLPLKGKLI